LALKALILEGFEMYLIQLEVKLEGPIRQAAPLAQEGNRLIHDRDKVHLVPSLLSAEPPCSCATPS